MKVTLTREFDINDGVYWFIIRRDDKTIKHYSDNEDGKDRALRHFEAIKNGDFDSPEIIKEYDSEK